MYTSLTGDAFMHMHVADEETRLTEDKQSTVIGACKVLMFFDQGVMRRFVSYFTLLVPRGAHAAVIHA